MLYLAGGYDLSIDAQVRDDVGYMLEPRMGRRISLAWVPFAIDNGCFSKTYSFDLVWWIRDLLWIARRYLRTCLFVVAPDVVGNAWATFDRSLPLLPLIRSFGYRAAYVTQDGHDRFSPPWDMFDVLFVGGTNAWKDSEASWALCREARARGKSVHVGRVNGLARLERCVREHVESADGTMLNFHPTLMWDKLSRILDAAKAPSSIEMRASVCAGAHDGTA